MSNNDELRKEVERVEELLARLRGAKKSVGVEGPRPISEVVTKVIYELAEQDKANHERQSNGLHLGA